MCNSMSQKSTREPYRKKYTPAAIKQQHRNDLKCENNSIFKYVGFIGCAWLPTSKTKIKVFWKFFLHSGSPWATLHSKKFQKRLILAFEADSALSCQNGLFSAF